MKFRLKNANALDGNDSWDNNPTGIAFNAVRNDTGATIFNSRTTCTGGATTTYLPGGGAGGAGGLGRIVAGGTTTNINSDGTYTVNGVDIEITQFFQGNAGSGGSANTAGNGASSAFVLGAGGDLSLIHI